MSELDSDLIVFVTASSVEEARKIAAAVLEPRLAACVNIIPSVESHYWWKGELHQDSEVQLLIKTSRARFPQIEFAVRAAHSYECPEIVGLEPALVTLPYRAWWRDTLAAGTGSLEEKI